MKDHKILVGGIILFFLALLPCLGQEKANPGTSARPLSEILNPDGTLNLRTGIRGSFNPKGFRMVTGADGRPAFIPAGFAGQGEVGPAASAAGDECWDSQFGNFFANADVYTLATFGSTEVYVGGAFTNVGGQAVSRIAKWDTTTNAWTSLGDLNGNVYALAASETDLYVGGGFTDAGGSAQADHIAKWNGSTWSALGNGLNSDVTMIVVNGADIYAGGWFDHSGDGSQILNHIAKWNGSGWSSLGDGASNGVNNTVYGIGVAGLDVYVGGAFTQAGGVARNYIAKWNGSSWSEVGGGMNGEVYWIAVGETYVLAGGQFTQAGSTPANHIALWSGTAWYFLGSGVNNGVNGNVFEIAINGTDVYVGGAFTQAGGVSANNIARWDGSAWSALGSGINGNVWALAVRGSIVYTGGQFIQAGGHTAPYIALWATRSWQHTGSGLNNTVRAIAVSGTDVYVGGGYTNAGGIPEADYIAKWNGSSWSALGSGLNAWVYALAANETDLYVGGAFTDAGGIMEADYIAKWNISTTTWSALPAPGLNGPVYAIAVKGSDVYVGGAFSQAGGGPANNIAKWDGSTWSALSGLGLNGPVYAITEAGPSAPWALYVGGNFTNAGNVGEADYIAECNTVATGWSALGYGLNGPVYAIASDGSDVYVGGDFSGYFTDTGGIVETDYIVKWNTAANSWSALGSGLNSFVYTIAVSGKDIYVGGYFINAGGIAEADYIAMWHGADWSALGSGMDNNVNTIAEARETIYTGGSFSIAGGKPSSCFGGWMIPLSLTSPNGGEIWAAGSLHDITWKGTSGPVKLEYSTDDGSTWTTIVSSTDNDGNYGWSVPNTPSSQCRVRISHAADGNPVDSSDAAFLIAGFQLTSPNGGESWNADSHQTIRWNTIGSYADVRIDLSTNNGSTWRTLDWAAVNTGSYTWTPLPEMVSSLCLIRVVNWDSEVPYDTSDAVFSIIPAVVQTITVDSPNGGETWQAGTMRDVTWIYAGLAGDVKIDLYKGGVYSRTLGTANVNLRTYNWSIEISQPSGTDYRIRVWQGSVIDESDGDFAIVAAAVRKDDFVGTWDGQGVYYQNSDTGAWAKLASPATKITVGDLDGDGIDDLIGLWPGQGGIWVKYSQSGAWAKLSSTAQYIAAGDMNGDDRVDLVGTWDGQGVFYRNSVSGAWVKMATPATMVTAGDIDNDGIDDLIGLWPSQGGIWVKYSQTGTWAKLSSTAVHIATGDMNGDKRDDLLGTWDGQGVFYRDSATGTWVKMASPATLITTGDIDGDAIDDLIGIWPTQGGVWVKYSSDRTWERLSSTAQDIAAGKMRAASGGGEVDHSEGALGAQQEFVEFPLPMGGTEEGPGVSLNGRDLSDRGPGGARFVYLEDINLEPREGESARLMRVPGPGESGVRWIEQDNLFPQETPKSEKKASIDQRTNRKK